MQLDILSSNGMLKRKLDTMSGGDGTDGLGPRGGRMHGIHGAHLLSVREFDLDRTTYLLACAERMKLLVKQQGGDSRLKHRVLASVFYEPSTRTSCSFSAAMLRLGGSVVSVNAEQSSIQKGETLEDTIQTMGCYCDAIVLRHPVKGSAAQAAAVSTKPVINAGDGTGEHPTQALLDLFTIHSELPGRLLRQMADPEAVMTVALLGDLKNGRTVHSLVKMLSLFPCMRLIYLSPPSLAMPAELVEEIAAIPGRAIAQVTTMTLAEAILEADVLYVTRIQKERFASPEEYAAVCGSYCVDAELMQKAKQSMIVMHPLPRNAEIATDVDSDPRAAYFRQMENGMYMRMAILDNMING